MQEQPYLIIVRRRPVTEIRKDAKRLGCQEWETIEGESDGLYKGDDEQNNSDSLGNELVRFWKSEDGRVHYCRSCGRVMIEQDVANRNDAVSCGVSQLEAEKELLSRRDGDQTAHQYAD